MDLDGRRHTSLLVHTSICKQRANIRPRTREHPRKPCHTGATAPYPV
ncbi:hypothetical protein KF707C_53400 [Metapseudomonas furukawaii]|uniref:Uncharacterized protein n=1 Tax=Metapseudomonas furukawaii TaxID=1149133 RepID=A0AAD1C639_METFU|nr:hypothetical protein KF707C_53400 [Pseudomonas furukawaii]